MRNLFQENRNAFLLLLVLLFLLSFTVYFFFFRPLAADLRKAEGQEQTLRTEINKMEVKEAKLKTEQTDGDKEIEELKQRQKIAETPELETFLRTLNEIELVSDSRIDKMSFGYDGEMPEYEAAEEQEEELTGEEIEDTGEAEKTGESEATGEADEMMEDLEEEQESAIEMAEMPEGLQPIIVTVEIRSPDYEHFQLFLQEIEKQERVMFVSNLEFEKPAERELIIEESSEAITAALDITTFYYEGEK